MEPFVYFLPSTLSLRKLRQHLPLEPHYQVILEQGEMQGAELLDTFDNGLFQAARLLFQVDRQLLLLDLQTGQLFEQAAPAGRPAIGDMAKGPVVDMLLEVSRLRSLLPVVGIRMRRDEGRVLDDEGKTLVRFYHLTIGRGRRKFMGMGCAQYLRGYSEAYSDLWQWLENCGAMACQNAGDIYSGLGIALRQYCVKPELELLPQTPVKESVTAILGTFLKIGRQNEQGVIADIDTEFLHDYRVCFRKVRSVLSLCTGVFDAKDSARLKEHLAAIMRTTNGLRDLDVYLLNRAEYYRLVPPSAHAGLQILFDSFAQKRKGEQKKVSSAMQSKGYLRSMENLEKIFAVSDNIKSGPQAEVSSLTFARRLILKRYRKVCKTGRDLDETTPDQVIHQLRIHCKKLRYLMEFFAPLFPSGEIKKLIRSLKLLQDNLGNFNDYSVQQQFLEKMLASDIASGTKAMVVAHSIGALTAMLHQLQGHERKQIIENLAGFDSLDIRDSFKELFLTEEGADEDNSLLQ
ncbi:MAG: CHAD domain-containing protein [Proteobacteria bacterium]|nr:CHAD domain-containing protein [Pseudomonadota bacterium]